MCDKTIAQIHNSETYHIRELINRNIARFKENIDFIDLKEINKNTALILCIFLGYFGAHKFYEGKGGMGILYLFTAGLFGIGWIVDIITIAMKPNPYYV